MYTKAAVFTAVVASAAAFQPALRAGVAPKVFSCFALSFSCCVPRQARPCSLSPSRSAVRPHSTGGKCSSGSVMLLESYCQFLGYNGMSALRWLVEVAGMQETRYSILCLMRLSVAMLSCRRTRLIGVPPPAANIEETCDVSITCFCSTCKRRCLNVISG